MSADRLERWFSRRDNHYQLTRKSAKCVFAEHNMTKDPLLPAGFALLPQRVYLLCPELQKKLLPVFTTPNPGGICFWPLRKHQRLEESFETLDLKWKFTSGGKLP
jgi:hypothetical protein